MATQVRFENVLSSGGSLWFRFANRDSFIVKSLNEGVMVIEPICRCGIHSFAKNVAGCFEKDSNFYGLKSIEIEFEGGHISVTAKNADPDKIAQLWKEKMEEDRIKWQKEREEYMKTSKYRAERAKELKAEYRRQNVRELVKQSMQTEELLFKDEEARKIWEDFVEANSKNGLDMIRYAKYWAKSMQYIMAKHEGVKIAQIADETSRIPNINIVSGFQFGCAMNILFQVWKYGEELREWHYKKYGYEGDDVVNPDMLTDNVG
jgi:hypothetical protein